MALNKPIEAITEQDLQALVDQQEPEGRTIDYKVAQNLDNEEAKAEFRRDVTSFANSAGGDMVIGIEDVNGIPVNLCGFDLGTQSQERYQLRIRDILQSRIKPRVPGTAVRPLQLQNGKWAAIVRIPRSFAPPHQVEVGNKDFQFWFRHDAGKQRMDIDEIRSLILLSDTLAEKIRNFRLERLGRIVSGEGPIPLLDYTKIVMHVVPLNAFDVSMRYDLAIVQQNSDLTLPIFFTSGSHLKYNFDGLYRDDKHSDEPGAGSYVQVFRSGIVEAVEGRLFGYEGKRLSIVAVEDMLINSLNKYLTLQSRLGVTPPVLVMLSFLDIKGYSLVFESSYRYANSDRVINEQNLLMPEELINQFNSPVDQILKPIFDRLWNAAGWPGSLSYDENGIRQIS